jgi:hypothetical protein
MGKAKKERRKLIKMGRTERRYKESNKMEINKKLGETIA